MKKINPRDYLLLNKNETPINEKCSICERDMCKMNYVGVSKISPSSKRDICPICYISPMTNPGKEKVYFSIPVLSVVNNNKCPFCRKQATSKRIFFGLYDERYSLKYISSCMTPYCSSCDLPFIGDPDKMLEKVKAIIGEVYPYFLRNKCLDKQQRISYFHNHISDMPDIEYTSDEEKCRISIIARRKEHVLKLQEDEKTRNEKKKEKAREKKLRFLEKKKEIEEKPHLYNGAPIYLYGNGCCEHGTSKLYKISFKQFKKEGVPRFIYCSQCQQYYLRASVYKDIPEGLININAVYKSPEGDLSDSISISQEEIIHYSNNTSKCCEKALDHKKMVIEGKNGPIYFQGYQCPECKKYYVQSNVFVLLRDSGIKNKFHKMKREKAAKEERLDEPSAIDTAVSQKVSDSKDYYLETANFITRSNDRYCIKKEHSLQDITGHVKIMTSSGDLREVAFLAAYCKQCDKFFLSENEYQKLNKKGIILCNIVEKEFWRNEEFGKPGSGLSQKAIMKQMGYNVNQEAALTNSQRWSILETIIKEGMLSKYEVLSYLNFLINRNSNRSRFKSALEKWRMDREHISAYKVNGKSVEVDTITHTSYKTVRAHKKESL